jgi:phytol kinase
LTIPSWWWHQLCGGAAVAAWLVLLGVLVVLVGRRWPDQGEWSRKLAHIGAGPVVLIAWGLGIDRLVAVPAALAMTLAAAINHRRRLLPGIEDVDRQSYGTIAYGASFSLLLLLWWPAQRAAVAAAILVMALGDGLAGLLGRLVPSASWQVFRQRRSVVGTITMGVSSLLVLLAMAALAQAGGQEAVPTSAALVGIALAAVLVEQLAFAGLDNLTVPLSVAWLWIWAAKGG